MKTQSILTLRKAFVFKIDETYRGVSNIAVPFLIIYYLIFFVLRGYQISQLLPVCMIRSIRGATALQPPSSTASTTMAAVMMMMMGNDGGLVNDDGQ